MGLIITTSRELQKNNERRSEKERACIEENMALRANNEHLQIKLAELQQKYDHLLEIIEIKKQCDFEVK